MELLNDLGNDLALAFLVEKKHNKKIDSKTALALIERVKEVLRSVSHEEKSFPTNTAAEKAEKSVVFSSH